MKEQQRGFSLVELLVVVAIIGVLSAAGFLGYTRYIFSTKIAVNNANASQVLKAIEAASILDNEKRYEVCGKTIQNISDRSEVITPQNCIASLLADMNNPFTSTKYAFFWRPLPNFLDFNSGEGSAVNCLLATGPNQQASRSWFWNADETMAVPTHITIYPVSGIADSEGYITLESSAAYSDGTGFVLASCDPQGNETQALPIRNVQYWK